MRAGDVVLRCTQFAGICTVEYATVLREDQEGVWLDNRHGNRPSGPYVNGKKDMLWLGHSVIRLARNQRPGSRHFSFRVKKSR